MILIDSSAWIEFLRATGSPVHIRLRAGLDRGEELAITDPVVMEILAGARDDRDHDKLRRLLYGCTLLAIEGPADYEQAAEVYRVCRANGETLRRLIDCLIAAVAIRAGVRLLHTDTDFDTISRHTQLHTVSV